MPPTTRDERLVHDLQVMQKLADSSLIVDFETDGEPPEEYTVTFRGRGVTRKSGLNVELEFLEEHQFEIRLPFSYPQRAPDIRWITPIFHPNISNSGFINLEEIRRSSIDGIHNGRSMPCDPRVLGRSRGITGRRFSGISGSSGRSSQNSNSRLIAGTKP